MNWGVVLYGPPASGKDAITAELGQSFVLVPRLKSGPGRTSGYHMVTDADLAKRRAVPGELLWETQRYSARYMLTRSDVLHAADSASPVVHVGQTAAAHAVTSGVPELGWIVVDLRCSRDTAASRIAARDTGDDAERLTIYDNTPALDAADLVIDTDTTPPKEAARQIEQAITLAPLVVPVPTFRTEHEILDLDTTARYADLLSHQRFGYVLLNGPMGRGETSSEKDRSANIAVWQRYVPSHRIIAACWTATDITAAQEAGAQPLVMLQASTSTELERQLAVRAPGVWMYANPRYSSALITPDMAFRYRIAGVKLSKVDAPDLQRMRSTNPHATIVHGSSRAMHASFAAGASLV